MPSQTVTVPPTPRSHPSESSFHTAGASHRRDPRAPAPLPGLMRARAEGPAGADLGLGQRGPPRRGRPSRGEQADPRRERCSARGRGKRTLTWRTRHGSWAALPTPRVTPASDSTRGPAGSLGSHLTDPVPCPRLPASCQEDTPPRVPASLRADGSRRPRVLRLGELSHAWGTVSVLACGRVAGGDTRGGTGGLASPTPGGPLCFLRTWVPRGLG